MSRSSWCGAALWGAIITLPSPGCTPAATFVDGKMTVDPGFRVDAPRDDMWEVARNRVWHGEPLVVFRHVADREVALSFRMLRLPEEASSVPLEVLAEAQFLTGGLASGIIAEVDYTTGLLLGEQPAVAVLGSWTIRPVTRRVAQVSVRSPDGLVLITLMAPPQEIDALALDLERSLRHFELVTDHPVDPFLLDTVPMSDPSHDPGHFGP